MTVSMLTAWLLACKGAANIGADDQLEATEGDDEVADVFALRIDVTPSDYTHPDLLPESFTVSANDWTGLDLELSSPASFSGQLTGFEANEQAITVPGAEVGIAGRVEASVAGTPMITTTDTDETGRFSFEAVPKTGYTVSFVPDDARVAFLVQTVDLVGSTDLSTFLDFGAPLYGVIHDERGLGVSDLAVWAVDEATGVQGPAVVTGADGTYELRVFAGDYTVHAAPTDARYWLPTLSGTATVVDDAGARLDMAFDSVVATTVTGRLFDVDGAALDDVLVRFVATDLAVTPGGDLVVETETDGNGQFSVQVVAGEYEVVLIPPYEGSYSPTVLGEVVVVQPDLDQDLGALELGARPLIYGRVVAPGGTPVEAVRVQARELDFDGFTYETTTDVDGLFTLEAAEGALEFTLAPPSDVDAAVTFFQATSDILSDETLTLAEGEPVEGCVSHGGDPLAYTPIDIADDDDRVYATTTTGEDGCFAVRIDPQR